MGSVLGGAAGADLLSVCVREDGENNEEDCVPLDRTPGEIGAGRLPPLTSATGCWGESGAGFCLPAMNPDGGLEEGGTGAGRLLKSVCGLTDVAGGDNGGGLRPVGGSTAWVEGLTDVAGGDNGGGLRPVGGSTAWVEGLTDVAGGDNGGGLRPVGGSTAWVEEDMEDMAEKALFTTGGEEGLVDEKEGGEGA